MSGWERKGKILLLGLDALLKLGHLLHHLGNLGMLLGVVLREGLLSFGGVVESRLSNETTGITRQR
jgi:hypothetical protein